MAVVHKPHLVGKCVVYSYLCLVRKQVVYFYKNCPAPLEKGEALFPNHPIHTRFARAAKKYRYATGDIDGSSFTCSK